MAALVGPELVIGVVGFGPTIADALHDLGSRFQEHDYRLVPPCRGGRRHDCSGDRVHSARHDRPPCGEDRPLRRPLDWRQIAKEPPL
jgi:hypothetical protein